ncbi:hypothetical protein GCM10028791_37350 [Echinicola sediminis]
MSYYNELLKFLDQAQTQKLSVKSYIKEYKGTNVKVSFGKGNTAIIPWISFLIKPNVTSKGIYPVYLFFKDRDLLILAYGVSEENSPFKNWEINNLISIKEYFSDKGLNKPRRYGNSYVFKSYSTKDLPNQEVIDKDLNNLIDIYKTIDFISNDTSIKEDVRFNAKDLYKNILLSGLIFNKKLITRFTASLLTKPFVILTGLAGSGKTKLAQAFVQWISQDDSQYRIVPVGADCTNREPLLGYPNALNIGEYIQPDTDVLQLILDAQNHPDLPYFLILDEMNLSHVERYFADFLSVMESNDDILLFSGTSINGISSKLRLPKNLFIIGTVNIDETTNMFSPKVLDRANTIEFRVSEEDMKSFFKNVGLIDLEELNTKGAAMASSFLEMAQSKEINPEEEVRSELLKFFGELKQVGAEFGYRTATEILRLVHHLSKLDEELETEEKIDIAIMQKLLPKLHGSQRKLRGVLESLGGFCLHDRQKIREVLDNKVFDFSNKEIIKYPISLEKIHRMYHSCLENGFASFAEA